MAPRSPTPCRLEQGEQPYPEGQSVFGSDNIRATAIMIRRAGATWSDTRVHNVAFYRGRIHQSLDLDDQGLEPRFSPGLVARSEISRRLALTGTSFDSRSFRPHIPELTDLAGKYPDTPVILDHVGAPLAIGAYAGKRDELFLIWKRNLEALAERPERSRQARRSRHAFCSLRPRRRTSVDSPLRRRNSPRSGARMSRPASRYFRHRPLHVREQLSFRQAGNQLVVLWNAFKRIVRDYSMRRRLRCSRTRLAGSTPTLGFKPFRRDGNRSEVLMWFRSSSINSETPRI